MATKTKGQNKSAFVRDFIQKNPQANRKAVEEAWLAAGHDGVIASALVSNLRSKLGLTAASKKAESNGTPESVTATIRGPRPKKRGRPSKAPGEPERLGIGQGAKAPIRWPGCGPC